MAQQTVMTAFYRSGDGAVVRLQDTSLIPKALSDRNGLLWVDLLISPNDDGSLLRDVFKFHPLAIEDCLSPIIDPAKIDDYGDYIFIVVQALGQFQPERELEPIEVDFFLGPNYVASCHQQPLASFENLQKRCERDELVLKHGADWFLHALLDALVDEFLPVVDAMDETLDELEEELLRHPDTLHLQKIMLLRRNTLRLRRATSPQRDIMNRLSRGEFPRLIRNEATMYYRDIYDHLVRIEYLVEALRDLADGALNTYLSVMSNRINEVIRWLTVFGTPLLVVTLIASIYGMNFTPGFWPPAEERWSFGAVLAASGLIGLLVLAYFRWRRWI